MNTLDALVTAVLGYAVVFLGILLLILVVVLMGRAMVTARKRPAAAAPEDQSVSVTPLPHEPKAPGTAGDLMLYDTPDEIAAMIMAIVADELKIPINELRFISIKEVNRK